MFVSATQEQAFASLRAASTLVDPSGLGQSLLVGASQLFFSPPVDIDAAELTPIAPEQLAMAIGPDRDLAEHVASLLVVASLADARINDDRLRRVVEYAHHLGVHEGWVRDMLQIARGHFAWTMADMVRRNVATFPGWGDGEDHVPDMMPYQQQTAEDKRLAERYLELQTLAPTTFGRAFYEHFRRHRFAFPGEYDAFAGPFAVPHDSLHVISGYSTSLQGEILVSTFTGGMHRRDNMRAHILPVIIEWHVGGEVNGIGAQRGHLDPAKFLVAWQRGEHTTLDVLSSQWDFWDWAPRDLEEIRAAMSVEALPAEYEASGEEIIGR